MAEPALLPPPDAVNELAAMSGALLRDRGWRHRQVDTVEVTDSLTTRTHTSIDFSIPASAPALRLRGGGMAGEGDQYLLPVTALGKWPPFDRFDLRDDRGVALPLLRGEENRRADAAALLDVYPGLPLAVQEELREIVESDPRGAIARQRRLTELLLPLIPSGSGEEAEKERVLLAIVKHWAAVLATNSLIWVSVRGPREDRRLVKIDIERPLDDDLNYWRRVEQSFSWAPTRVLFDLPVVSACLTYHLQFSPPRELQVIGAELGLYAGPGLHENAPSPAPAPPLSEALGPLLARFGPWLWGLLGLAYASGLAFARQRWRLFTRPEGSPASPGELEPEPGEGMPYERFDSRSAHLYVSRPRLSLPVGVAQIELRARRAGVISGALIAATLIALIMTLYAATAPEIERHLSPAVTVLVLAPGLIGFLASRPEEHPLLRRNLRSVRGVLVVAGAVPILAAILLVVIGDGNAVRWAWAGLAFLSWLLVGLLTISWLLPPKPSGVP